MSWCIGIDPSLSGFAMAAINEEDELDVSRWASPSYGTGPRARVRRVTEMLAEVYETLRELTPGIILIEDYAYSKNQPSTYERAELGGMLRYGIIDQWPDCQLCDVPIGTLKKYGCGKGNANKIEVVAGVIKRWKVEFSKDDEYDAYVLARLGQAVLGITEPANEPQRGAVALVKDRIEKDMVNGKDVETHSHPWKRKVRL